MKPSPTWTSEDTGAVFRAFEERDEARLKIAANERRVKELEHALNEALKWWNLDYRPKEVWDEYMECREILRGGLVTVSIKYAEPDEKGDSDVRK